MSKFLGVATAAFALVMALACGGSSNGNPGTTVYSDAAVSAPADKVASLGLSKAVLSSGANTDISASNEAIFKNVVPADYTVYAGNVSMTSANATTDALYQALISVASDGGTTLRSKVPDVLQINAVTSLFAKMSTEDPTTYALIKDKIKGKKFTVTDGAVSGLEEALGSGELLSAIDTATALVEVLVEAKKQGTLNATEFAAQLKTLSTSSGNMTNLNAVLTSASFLQTMAETLIKNSSFSFPANLSSVTGLSAATLTATAGNITNLLALPKKSVTEMTTAANANFDASATISDVMVPTGFHDGDSSATGFKVDTLAPAFKVTFASPVLRGEKVASALTMTLKNETTSVTKEIKKSTSGVSYVWSDSKTLYIVTSSNELDPGVKYSYTLASNVSTVSVGSFATGMIETYPVTVTHNVVPVSLGVPGYTGVSVSNLQLTVSSNTALNVADATAAKALIKNFSVTGTSTGSYSSQTFTASDIDVTLSTDKKSATVKLSSTANTVLLTPGEYTLSVTLDSTVVPAANYNGTMKVTIK
jgi:hypothetical protein